MREQEQSQAVAVIGAGLDLGAGRRGVDMGPSAIRYAGLDARIESLGRACFDWGDVTTAIQESEPIEDERARYLPAILGACTRVADLVERARSEGLLPLVLGGDHSVAMGTLGGMARTSGAGGVLWIDAHGDLNDPASSPSGNVHGMPLAAALGLAAIEHADALDPDACVLDLHMPLLDGVTAAARLRRDHPNICLIALTADDDARLHEAVREAGADAVLLKGQMVDALVRRLGAVRAAASR